MENEYQLENNYCGDLPLISKIWLFNVLVTEHYVERLLIICYFENIINLRFVVLFYWLHFVVH
jgi:hypothetical protein